MKICAKWIGVENLRQNLCNFMWTNVLLLQGEHRTFSMPSRYEVKNIYSVCLCVVDVPEIWPISDNNPIFCVTKHTGK